jgi:hypothetical protein
MSVKNYQKSQESTARSTSLPAMTKIYHSTKLNSQSFKGFDIIHNRLLVYAISYYQNEIKGMINGQIKIDFKNPDKYLKIPIYLNEIVNSRKGYSDVIESAKELEEFKVEQNVFIDEIEYKTRTRIFNQVYEPIIVNKKSAIYVDINRSLFEEIVNVFYNNSTALYTSYYKEVIMKTQNRYLPKMYWFLSSNEKLGKRKIAFNDLIDLLGIDRATNETYTKIGRFNERVLKPIQKELYETCKFFFSFTFHKYKDREDYYYNFTIINHEELLKIEKQMDFIKVTADEIFPIIGDELVKHLIKKGYTHDLNLLSKISTQLLDLKISKRYTAILKPIDYLIASIEAMTAK